MCVHVCLFMRAICVFVFCVWMWYICVCACMCVHVYISVCGGVGLVWFCNIETGRQLNR